MLEWNDFQILLSIQRSGTLSDAGRRLKVSQSTISRALQRIERQSRHRVFLNIGNRYQVTPEGQRLLTIAEKFDAILDGYDHQAASTAELAGIIRLTSIEPLVASYLIEKLSHFRRSYPRVEFELNGSNETKDLLKRGYDLSLRLDRERKSGSLIQSKVAEFGVAIYSRDPEQTQWIGYETALSGIPEEKWLREKLRGTKPTLRVGSYLSMEKAIETGLGMGLLPCLMGDKNPHLKRIGSLRPVFHRHLWLISHPEVRREPCVDDFVKWLTVELKKDSKLLLG